MPSRRPATRTGRNGRNGRNGRTDEAAPPTPLALWVVAFGVFIAADDLMVVATMLRPMMDDVGLILPGDLDASAWIVNVYLIAYITAIPLAGRLSDIFGRRAVFVSGLLLFMLGSLVVPAADSLAVLLVGRALSAVGGGALVPVALAVAGDLYRGPRRSRALGTLGAVETLGWVWGPLYGAVLVRLASWEWQFHLNLPLAALGIVAGWRVLGTDRRAGRRIDWLGATLLTIGLVALNVALLGQADIQSVSGLDELTGEGGDPAVGAWLYPVAAVAFGLFYLVERRRSAGGRIEPVVAVRFGRKRGPVAALAINALVGVGLVIALVNVPLFVNVLASGSGTGIGPTALRAGWLLTALTTAMAVMSYVGGVVAGRTGNGPPTVVGLALVTLGFGLMGWTWSPDAGSLVMASELALVGAGCGLVLTPTSGAVVSAAGDADRGAAAGLLIVFRLIGFSVGLAALTAWGLHRFNELRSALTLPALGQPGYEAALTAASVDITATALSETFIGAGLAAGVALLLAVLVHRRL